MEAAADAIKWFASGSGMIAALVIAMDLGRKPTGIAFLLFVASSIAWFTGAWLTDDWALATQNGVLFAINLLGVYRHLLRRKDA